MKEVTEFCWMWDFWRNEGRTGRRPSPNTFQVKKGNKSILPNPGFVNTPARLVQCNDTAEKVSTTVVAYLGRSLDIIYMKNEGAQLPNRVKQHVCNCKQVSVSK